MNNIQANSNLNNILVGIQGGAFASASRLAVYPLEVWSTRRAVKLAMKMNHCFKGAMSSLFLNFAKQGIMIGSGKLVYDAFKNPIVTGCAVGSIESLTQPVNTLRTTMQTKCLSLKDSASSLGMKGLYRGLVAVWIRNQLWQGSQLGIYSVLRDKNDPITTSMLKGQASALSASVLSFPMQRVFVEQAYARLSFAQAAKKIFTEMSCFRGITPALARVIATGLVLPFINSLILDDNETTSL